MTSTLDPFLGAVLYFRDRGAQQVQYGEVVAVMPDADGLSLLDVGCGWGDFSAFLPESCRYLGIDIRPEVIEVAKGAYRDRQFKVSKRITKADIIVAIGAIGDEVIPGKKLVERMWAKAGRAVVFTLHAAYVHNQIGEDRFREWCPKEPDVFDRRDDFFRVALYK